MAKPSISHRNVWVGNSWCKNVARSISDLYWIPWWSAETGTRWWRGQEWCDKLGRHLRFSCAVKHLLEKHPENLRVIWGRDNRFRLANLWSVRHPASQDITQPAVHQKASDETSIPALRYEPEIRWDIHQIALAKGTTALILFPVRIWYTRAIKCVILCSNHGMVHTLGKDTYASDTQTA